MKIPKLVVAAFFSFAFVVPCSAQSQDPPDPSELKTRIVKRDYTDVSDIDRWEIKASYPEVRLEGDVPAPGFNLAVKSLAMKEVSRFKQEMEKEASESPAADRMNYDQLIGYEVAFFDKDLISIKLFQSEYTGGAHPNHWTHALSWDLSKDRRIDLEDLFKSGSEYLKIISDHSIASLREKMGENADTDWIQNGAGPELKNFSSWNISAEGLRFTFDPYQVGPYAAGSFEATLAYKKFPPEVRGSAFDLAEATSFIDGSPPGNCRGGRWTVLDTDYSLAVVKGKKSVRAYFYRDETDCPNCRRNAYVIAGDEVIVQREYGEYSCVWFQPSKGAETVGWLRSEQLKKRPDISRPPRNWVGEWKYASNNITIKQSPSEKLHVYGTAIWKGLGENVHVGEIDFLEYPHLDQLKVGDGVDKYDCRVRLRRLGNYLIVNDNLMCGGANVSFNGVYIRD